MVAGILRYGLLKKDFDVSAPIVYGIDGILDAMMAQGLIEGDYFPPGVLKSDRLSAPDRMVLGDFPTFDAAHLLVMKGISLFTSKPFLICNLYFLLSFLFAGLAFLWTARAFGIAYPFSIAGAVLFAFGEYRILRFQHLFLAAYAITAPLIWVMAQSWSRKPLLFSEEGTPEKTGKWNFDWKDKRLLPILATAAVGGWSGVYFTAFFLVLATACAVHSAFHYRSWSRLVSSIFPVVMLFLSFLIGASPNLAYRVTHGKTAIGARHFSETEVLGLTLPEALLPIGGDSNFRWVNEHIAHKYKPRLPMAEATYLGAWGILGFVVVVVIALFYGASIAQSIPTQLGFISVILLLYALRGGFGLMFSILISPNIRALSRIVVYMAPLGLLGICAILSAYIKPKRLAFIAGVGMLLTGVIDQVQYRSFSNHPLYLKEFRQDQTFFPFVEKMLPVGSSVFQLPVMEFPESPGYLGIGDYDQLRPYLSTKQLRWSGGAVSQRETIHLLKTLGEMPMDIGAIERAGFSAILIDGRGYADQGKTLRDYLHQKLGREPLVSEDGRWIVFPFTSSRSS